MPPKKRVANGNTTTTTNTTNNNVTNNTPPNSNTNVTPNNTNTQDTTNNATTTNVTTNTPNPDIEHTTTSTTTKTPPPWNSLNKPTKGKDKEGEEEEEKEEEQGKGDSEREEESDKETEKNEKKRKELLSKRNARRGIAPPSTLNLTQQVKQKKDDINYEPSSEAEQQSLVKRICDNLKCGSEVRDLLHNNGYYPDSNAKLGLANQLISEVTENTEDHKAIRTKVLQAIGKTCSYWRNNLQSTHAPCYLHQKFKNEFISDEDCSEEKYKHVAQEMYKVFHQNKVLPEQVEKIYIGLVEDFMLWRAGVLDDYQKLNCYLDSKNFEAQIFMDTPKESLVILGDQGSSASKGGEAKSRGGRGKGRGRGRGRGVSIKNDKGKSAAGGGGGEVEEKQSVSKGSSTKRGKARTTNIIGSDDDDNVEATSSSVSSNISIKRKRDDEDTSRTTTEKMSEDEEEGRLVVKKLINKKKSVSEVVGFCVTCGAKRDGSPFCGGCGFMFPKTK